MQIVAENIRFVQIFFSPSRGQIAPSIKTRRLLERERKKKRNKNNERHSLDTSTTIASLAGHLSLLFFAFLFFSWCLRSENRVGTLKQPFECPWMAELVGRNKRRRLTANLNVEHDGDELYAVRKMRWWVFSDADNMIYTYVYASVTFYVGDFRGEIDLDMIVEKIKFSCD